MYDYLIIGGGLAGATLGYLLKKQGCNVLILEKQILKKKNKVCAGLLSPRAHLLLKKIFPQEEIDDLIIHSFNKIKVNLNDQELFEKKCPLKLTIRSELDNYVLSKYLDLGGQIVENIDIKDFDFQQKVVMTNKGQFYYKFLIAADGVFSSVRKKIFGKTQDKNFWIQSSSQEDKIQTEQLEVYFKSGYMGFSYLFSGGMIKCLGSGAFEEKQVGQNFEKYLLKKDLDFEKKQGWFIPSGREIYLQTDDDIWFIGDAAGLACPLTGEGIFFALYSALALIQTFLKNDDYLKIMEGPCKEIEKKIIIFDKIKKLGVENFLFY